MPNLQKNRADCEDPTNEELRAELTSLNKRIRALEETDDRRRRAENALREGEEQLLTLINAMPDLICFKDGSGKWLQANEFGLRLFEIEQVAYKGKTDSELAQYSKFYRDAFLNCEYSDELAWAAGKTVRSDEVVPKSDGTVMTIDIIKVPLFYPDGSRKGLVVIGRDITERKRAEEGLRKARDELEIRVRQRTAELEQANLSLKSEIDERKNAEEALRKSEEALRFTQFAIDRSQDQAFWMTGDGRIFYVNEAACRSLGYSREELLNLSIPDIDPIFPRDVFDKNCSELQNRCSQTIDTLHRAKNGRVYPVEIRSNLVVFDGREYNCAFATDITERKRSEEALKSAKAQAELYLDLMGHDINNLNQSAMGFLDIALQLLETGRELGPDQQSLIEKPLTALKSSSALIDNVRKLQRLMTEGVKIMPVDLSELFKKLKVHNLLPNHREVTLNVEAVPNYRVEANELLQDVFTNLITNAIKHSDEDKPLVITVKVEHVRENDRMYYKCIVEDDGPGIADALKEKLFHRFQRGATTAHGKGLGLYLVRTLVDGYGGKVWVEDRVPGNHKKGARFVVMLREAGM